MDPYHELKVNHSQKSRSFNLLDLDPNLSGSKSKKDSEIELTKILNGLEDLHYKLYAENKRSVLVILQGVDAAGKDGTIRHVMQGLNPQSCVIRSFKKPNDEEMSHDYLWRVHDSIPPFGYVSIFNRSHYEDLVEPTIEGSLSKKIFKNRIRQINDFERYLSENNITIVKFFLYISKDEQKRRLLERIHDPKKHWKFSEADLLSHRNWQKYMQLYSDILKQTNKKWAQWFVIPANVKYFRNWAVSYILLRIFESMNPQFPKVSIDPRDYFIE